MYIKLISLIIAVMCLMKIFKFNKSVKKFFVVNVFIIITLIAGLRFNVGRDYINYQDMFVYQTLSPFPEFIYWLINYVINQLSLQFYVVTLLMASIITYYIYKGLRIRNVNANYILLSILLFISSIWLSSFNITRQCVAVAIFFYASYFIKEKKLFKYLIYILIASGFHISALILLPLYWLFSKPIGIERYLVYLTLAYGIVISNIGPKLLNLIVVYFPMYKRYVSSQQIFNKNTNIFSIVVLIQVVCSIVILYLYKKNVEDNYIKEANFYLIGNIFNILAMSSYLYNRIGIYFVVFQIFFLPYIVSKIKDTRERLLMGIVIIIMIGAIYYARTIGAAPEELMTYQSIFG